MTYLTNNECNTFLNTVHNAAVSIFRDTQYLEARGFKVVKTTLGELRALGVDGFASVLPTHGEAVVITRYNPETNEIQGVTVIEKYVKSISTPSPVNFGLFITYQPTGYWVCEKE